jgi:diguanylate cyclase (GGDEF)-like protein
MSQIVPFRPTPAQESASPSEGSGDVGALRSEVERLAAELAAMRAHAAALEALAHEDPLTGVLNRRGFLRDLERAIAYTARYSTPVALLLADLDGFKPINDRFGHEAGDRALKHVAGLFRMHVRASDSVGRIGGDEFGVILWQCDDVVARRKAASLEEIIAGQPLESGEPLRLASSIGATILRPRDGVEEALARADRAMYARKVERRALGG